MFQKYFNYNQKKVSAILGALVKCRFYILSFIWISACTTHQNKPNVSRNRVLEQIYNKAEHKFYAAKLDSIYLAETEFEDKKYIPIKSLSKEIIDSLTKYEEFRILLSSATFRQDTIKVLSTTTVGKNQKVIFLKGYVNDGFLVWVLDNDKVYKTSKLSIYHTYSNWLIFEDWDFDGKTELIHLYQTQQEKSFFNHIDIYDIEKNALIYKTGTTYYIRECKLADEYQSRLARIIIKNMTIRNDSIITDYEERLCDCLNPYPIDSMIDSYWEYYRTLKPLYGDKL